MTAARLVMAELAAARAEVEAATTTDAARAAVAELEALYASSTGSSVSSDDDRDNELKLARAATREQAAQWAAAHPQRCRGGSPDGRGCAGGAPGEAARCGRAPDGGGSQERRGRAGGWVDGDRDLYIWRGSPSLDRYLGHHGIQAIVKDVGPDGGWPTLTKANYVEWATSHRWRRSQLCSWHTQASSYLQWHRPQRLSSTLMSREHTPSSTTAPAAIRLAGGASTTAPPIT
jgi:hypothetical protein